MVFGFVFVLLSQALQLLPESLTTTFPQVRCVPDITSRCILEMLTL